MRPTVESLYQSALTLTDAERLSLAEALLIVSDSPPSPELAPEDYLSELRRRSADSDPSQWSTWETVQKRVPAKR